MMVQLDNRLFRPHCSHFKFKFISYKDLSCLSDAKVKR